MEGLVRNVHSVRMIDCTVVGHSTGVEGRYASASGELQCWRQNVVALARAFGSRSPSRTVFLSPIRWSTCSVAAVV